MPEFVIERQYLVPMYQHIVVEAENLDAACKKAHRSPRFRPGTAIFAPSQASRLA